MDLQARPTCGSPRRRVVTYPQTLLDLLRAFQRQLVAIGGPVFPRQDHAERPARAALLSVPEDADVLAVTSEPRKRRALFAGPPATAIA